MFISFKGYNTKSATFYTDTNVQKGDWVITTCDYTVRRCLPSETPCGVCVNTDGIHACIQLQGYAKIKYAGNRPNYGRGTLASDGNNAFTVEAKGLDVLTVSVNEEEKTAEIIF